MKRTTMIAISIDAKTKRRLDALAAQEMRTRSGMLAWLVNQEFTRRVELHPTLAVAEAEAEKAV